MIGTKLAASALIALVLLTGPAWAQSPAPAPAAPTEEDETIAGLSNVFYVPGKVIVCGMSGAVWVGVMALTFGRLYDEAALFLRGGCGGRWVLKPEDLQRPR